MDFKQLKKDLDQSKVRTTSHKCSIKGDYDREEHLKITRRRSGIQIKWSCHVPIKSYEIEKCDMGHKHYVEKDTTWIWNYAELSMSDVQKLKEFLDTV